MNQKKIIARLYQLIKLANSDKGKERISKGFNEKIQKAGKIKGTINQARLLYQYFMDPKTSKTKKGLIGAALLYFIIPFDVVTDFIPVLGYVDDGIAIAYVWSLMEKELKNYREYQNIIDITDDVIIDED